MVADTVTDFVDGTDKVDLTAFDLDSVDEVTMTTGDDGVTIDLTDIGGSSILLADVTNIPEGGRFPDLEWFSFMGRGQQARGHAFIYMDDIVREISQ